MGKKVSIISVAQKKQFMRNFLSKYYLKKRECVWILNYFMSHDQLMARMKFVSEVDETKKTLVMSTHCSSEPPLRFYKNGKMTTDPEKTFHDIRLNRDDEVYIKIYFKDQYTFSDYLDVLEDYQVIQPPLQETKSKYEKIIDEFLSLCTYEVKVNQLKIEIDAAIEQGNKKAFIKLTNELKKIDKPDTNIEIIQSKNKRKYMATV